MRRLKTDDRQMIRTRPSAVPGVCFVSVWRGYTKEVEFPIELDSVPTASYERELFFFGQLGNYIEDDQAKRALSEKLSEAVAQEVAYSV